MKKILQSYWLRSGFFTFSERLVAMVLGLGIIMMLTRYLEKADFGVWVIFLTITSILEVGRIGLLQNGLIKFLSDNSDEDYPKILGSSIILNCILTGAIVLCLYGLSIPASLLFKADELAALLQVYCLTTVCLIPFFQFNFLQQANLNFKGVFFSTATKQGVLFLFIAYIFFGKGEMTLTDLAWVQVVAAIAASFVSFLFARKYTRISWTIDWYWIKQLFHYGKFVFGTNLSTMLYKSIDKMVLAAIPSAGKVAAAVYEAAIKVSNLADVPTFAMANILFPQSARKAKEGKEATKNLYEKAVGAILAIMIPCILFVEVFSEFIIMIVAGSKYLDSANVLRLTILYGLFMPFAVQFGTVLDSVGKPKINFQFTLASMILNVVFNVIFILQFGVYGAAIGTLSTYLVIFIFMQRVLHREFGVNFLNCFKNVPYFYKQGLLYLRKSPPSNTPQNGLNGNSVPLRQSVPESEKILE